MIDNQPKSPWKCDFCGDLFETKDVADKHEELCKTKPKETKIALNILGFKVCKEALEYLSLPVILLIMWDLIFISEFLSGNGLIDVPLTIGSNVLLLYVLTEKGFKKLTKLIKKVLAMLWIVIPFVILAVGIVVFLRLPPTTIIIILLLLLLIK